MIWGSIINADDCSYLQADDQQYLTVVPECFDIDGHVLTCIAEYYVETVVRESRTTVDKITITYDGKLWPKLTQYLYLYDWTRGLWVLFDRRDVGPNDVTVTFSTTDALTYISPSGQIRFKLSAYGRLFLVYSDFLSFTIYLK